MEEGARISCPVFQKHEPLIRHITDKINAAKNVKDKAEFAEELKQEADILLACADYDKKESDCKNCRFIAQLRQQTAELIIKAKKLA